MKIRHGITQDARMLSELGARTFYDAFARENTPENMDAYLKKSFSPQIQLDELSRSDVLFLIAEVDNIPVGYAQLILNSREESVEGNMPVEIRRIYALQEYIGKGVGSGLMSSALHEARERGCDVIWLGVWEKNSRAIDFYRKWGFREMSTHVFSLGDEPQTDWIMALKLDRSLDGSAY